MADPRTQELFTKSVFESLAHAKGFRFQICETDDGVDSIVKFVNRKKRTDGYRELLSSQCISIQHKSTSSTPDFDDSGNIKYPLEAKTYNDMIDYRNNNSCLLLVLSVLTKDTWVECCDDHQKYYANSYWYVIPETVGYTTNTSSVTIHIPKQNKFHDNTLHEIFFNLYHVEVPNV